MKFNLCIATLLASILAAIPVQAGDADIRVVVANYRTLMGAYGNTVAGYKQDIKDAEATGVDGFALELEGFQTPELIAIQKQEVADLFQAAAELGTHFKLFFDLDCFGYGYDDKCQTAAGAFMALYARKPSYFKLNGRPLFSGWSSTINPIAESPDHLLWLNTLAGIAATNPLFMPTFATWGRPPISGPFPPSQAYSHAEAWFTAGWLVRLSQGLMSWGQLVPSLAIANNDAYAAVATNHHLPFGSAVESWHSPIRFLSGATPAPTAEMVSLEFNGGEGLSAIWQDIIDHLKSPMVYLVTWNDYSESYISPASQAALTAAASGQEYNINRWQVEGPYLYSHAAYTELNKYFIQWYKTGRKPTWPDAMYVFYRTAPISTIPARAASGTQIAWDTQGNPTLDDLYITTILTSPATLTVSTGSMVVRLDVPAGLHHARVPFVVGPQAFMLGRGNASLIKITGADVVGAEDYYYNVNPTAYFGYYRPHSR